MIKIFFLIHYWGWAGVQVGYKGGGGSKGEHCKGAINVGGVVRGNTVKGL